MAVHGALIAYLVPPAFGLSVYVAAFKNPKKVEAAAFSWAVGWTTVNLVSFVANQFLRVPLNSTFYWMVTLALILSAAGLTYRFRKRLHPLVSPPFLPRDLRKGVGAALLLLLLAFVVLFTYKAMSIPPASTDAVVYHMVLPGEVLESGRLPIRPGIGWLDMVTAFPNLLVTQQLWIYLAAGGFNEVLVRPIMPVYSSLLLLVVFADTRRWFGLFPAALAASGLYSLTEFSSLTIVLWAEVPVAFYSYLAVRYAVATLREGSGLATAGVMAGSAALVKYNGLALFAALTLALIMMRIRDRRSVSLRGPADVRAPSNGSLLIFLILGALIAAPLLTRNALTFANPVYPYFLGGVNTAQIAYYYEAYDALGLVRIRLFEAVVLLGSVVMAGVVIGHVRRRTWSQTEWLLLLLLLFYLAIYVFPYFRGSYIRYLAPVIPTMAVLGGRHIAWWLSEASSRERALGMAVLEGMLLLVLGITASLDERPAYLREFVAFFLASSLALLFLALLRGRRGSPLSGRMTVLMVSVILLAPAFLAVAAERYPPRETAWDVSLMPEDPDTYLESRFGDDWRMWKWINANLPPDALILTFEPRLLYLERDVLFGASYQLIATYRGMPLEEAVGLIRQLGVKYVLDSPWSHVPEVNRIFWERSVLFQNLDNTTYFRVLHTEGEVILYEVVK
jgi:hypothetical protein